MSWVYFIQEGTDGPVKIGRSTDPWKRLEALQSGNPRQLRLVATVRVGKRLHFWQPKNVSRCNVSKGARWVS